MALKFAGAFFDGAFLALHSTTPTPCPKCAKALELLNNKLIEHHEVRKLAIAELENKNEIHRNTN